MLDRDTITKFLKHDIYAALLVEYAREEKKRKKAKKGGWGGLRAMMWVGKQAHKMGRAVENAMDSLTEEAHADAGGEAAAAKKGANPPSPGARDRARMNQQMRMMGTKKKRLGAATHRKKHGAHHHGRGGGLKGVQEDKAMTSSPSARRPLPTPPGQNKTNMSAFGKATAKPSKEQEALAARLKKRRGGR